MPHLLETEFELDAADILNIIARSPRCKQMVKGFVAEYHLEEILNALKDQGVLQSVDRIDADGKPDFSIGYSGRKLRIECKMAMSVKPTASGDFRIDFQKTRNSPANPLSRFYKRMDFDIVAVCLYNQTGKWEFRYVMTSQLPIDEKVGKDCLKKGLRYPGGLPWKSSLEELLSSIDEQHSLRKQANL